MASQADQSEQQGLQDFALTFGLAMNVLFLIGLFFITSNVAQNYFNVMAIFFFLFVSLVALACAVNPANLSSSGKKGEGGAGACAICVVAVVVVIFFMFSLRDGGWGDIGGPVSNALFLLALAILVNLLNHVLVNYQNFSGPGAAEYGQRMGLLHFTYGPKMGSQRAYLVVLGVTYSGATVAFCVYYLLVEWSEWWWIGALVIGIAMAQALYASAGFSQVARYSAIAVGDLLVATGLACCLAGVPNCLAADLVLSHIGIALLGSATYKLEKGSQGSLLVALNWMALGVAQAVVVALALATDSPQLAVDALKCAEYSLVFLATSYGVEWW